MAKNKTPYKAYREIEKSTKKPANTGRGISPNSAKDKAHKSTGTRAKSAYLKITEGATKPANSTTEKTPSTKRPKQSKSPTITSRTSGGGSKARGGGGGFFDFHQTLRSTGGKVLPPKKLQ